MNRAPTTQANPPSYPSSSKKAKDWDKIELEIKNEEKEEKPEGDEALNKYVFLLRSSKEKNVANHFFLDYFNRFIVMRAMNNDEP